MAEIATASTAHVPPLVLLVDDDSDTREMYGLFLAASGLAVEVASNAGEALDKIYTLLPDVVVTDLWLPGTHGFALCEAIKGDERTADIRVIALSGHSAPERVEHAKRSGFDAFILKPCLPEDLLDHIRRSIPGGSTTPGDVAGAAAHD